MISVHPANPAFCWCPLCQRMWLQDPVQRRLLEILEKVASGETKTLYEEAMERMENEKQTLNKFRGENKVAGIKNT